MTKLSSPEDYGPREQHNHGSGTFIGRDLRIETLDPKTKAVLVKLSKDTPALAGIVERALRDGVISPDAVFTLAVAARNINTDVADALWRASRNINEDVAVTLIAATKSINPGVASSIVNASSRLEKATAELDGALMRFQRASGAISSYGANVGEWEQVAEAMEETAQHMAAAAQARNAAIRVWSWNSFWWGVGVCCVAIIILLALGAKIFGK